MATDTQKPTKIVIGPVRLSFANLWTPVAKDETGEKKYSGAFLIPKTDKKSLKLIKEATEAAKEAGKTILGKVTGSVKTPLRDGDEKEEYEGYADHYYVNATAKTKPGIVDKNREPIVDQEEVYSGCYGYVSLTFYAFSKNGNKGIACGLNHFMKTKDGDNLGGRTSAEADFAEISIGDDEDDDLL